MFETLSIDREKIVFLWLHRVSAPDLHKADLLPRVYLVLFKNMMDWISGFLKINARPYAFNNIWKTLLRYPGFFAHKKAYHEVT